DDGRANSARQVDIHDDKQPDLVSTSMTGGPGKRARFRSSSRVRHVGQHSFTFRSQPTRTRADLDRSWPQTLVDEAVDCRWMERLFIAASEATTSLDTQMVVWVHRNLLA